MSDKDLPIWGERLRFLTDDRDHEERFELNIFPGGNGDWYVSVLPEGHRLGPTVRVSTSGGAARSVPGLGIAISRAYRAMLGEKMDDVFEPILANNHHHFEWCQPGDKHSQQWVLIFDDADMSTLFFDDKEKAYDAYSKADINWNCYLYGIVPRDPQKVHGVETSGYLWQNVVTGSRTLSFNKKVSEQQYKDGWRVYPIGIVGNEIPVEMKERV